MSLEHWLLFVGIWTLAGLPLGPNALNCIAVAAGAGFARALWAVAGILLAALCHMGAVVFGLAALLLASAQLFGLLKLLGAAYLIWMGVAAWRRGGLPPLAPDRHGHSALRLIRRAFLISMSNPKALLSYFAVFAQFVDPAAGLNGELAVLAGTALAITALIYVAYAAIGLGLGRLLSSAARQRLFNRSVGSFYILAGLTLAWSEASGTGRREIAATPS